MRWVRCSERLPPIGDISGKSETELAEVVVRFKGEYSGYRCELVNIEDMHDDAVTGDCEWLEGAFEDEVKS
jgi:hypothetical protein